MTDERSRWNARHAERPPPTEPADLLVRHTMTLPTQGRALDVAGGAGRHEATVVARRVAA